MSQAIEDQYMGWLCLQFFPRTMLCFDLLSRRGGSLLEQMCVADKSQPSPGGLQPWPFLDAAHVGRPPLPSPAQLSNCSAPWYSRGQYRTPPGLLFVVSSFVTAIAYVLLKGKEEGRQEVMYMGMLKNLKTENLLSAKCLRALSFCLLQENPNRDTWVEK